MERMVGRALLVGFANSALTVALATSAHAVAVTYNITPGSLSTLDSVQLVDPLSPYTPTPCGPNSGTNCLVGGAVGLTGGQITIDQTANQILSMDLYVDSLTTLDLGGLNGYDTA
jgi:hypothetical protein